MNIYNGMDSFSKFNNPIVTSGFFDGVHNGHQRVLKTLKEISKKNQGEVLVITFWPHPQFVLNPDKSPLQLLNTFEEKVELLKEQGVQNLLKIPFTRAFSKMSSQDFIENILVRRIGTKTLVIGYDHRFGKNREGCFEQLRKNDLQYNFEVEEIPREDIHNVGIGSSKIRVALLNGDVETATLFLGRPYSISGKVVKGDKVGRVMGFPTANLAINHPHKLIPKKGIYVVKIQYKGMEYGGMLYIGNRPTLNGNDRSIEVNIFNFDKYIYGEKINISLISLIREDMRFGNLEALKAQMEKDKDSSISLLHKRNLI